MTVSDGSIKVVESAPKAPARRKPADHLPKKDAARTVTVRGAQFDVPADALDDFELLDDLSELENGQAQRLPGVLKRLIGPDQFRKAMDLLRGESGRVSTEDGAKFVSEILEAVAPNS